MYSSKRAIDRIALLRLTACLALCVGLMATAVSAMAQAWPSRPITVIVPYPPGGGTDIGARTWGGLLEQELGVPVNVINRGGGYTLFASDRSGIAPGSFEPRGMARPGLLDFGNPRAESLA